MKTTEMKRRLREAGCYIISEDGKHEKWYSPITGETFPVPRHKTQEIPPGTLKSIRKAAGLEK